jgi:hypothetical protein
MKTATHALLALLLAFLSAASAKAAPSLSETEKITALISHIEKLQDATFLRNGTGYDAVTAGKFLRGKWHAHEKDIHTADDFIEKAASFSSTTGKPYLIRLSDGREVKCGDYLRGELQRLPAPPH